MALSKDELSKRGIAGALAKHAKYGGERANQQMRAGRLQSAMRQVRAWAAELGQSITDAECQTRAEKLITSQNLMALQRGNATRAAKAAAKANTRIRRIASPEFACCYCCAERDVSMPRHVTHRTCATHQRRTAAEMTQLSIRASHLRQI